ncbi:MAG: hypothetical protein AAGF73_01695 [Actinomycetota bacterium]
MSELDGFSIDCEDCPAVSTTACADCVVGHVIANDDGPIALRVAAPTSARERAIELFRNAGMLDDEPQTVDPQEFESATRRHPAAHLPVR